MSMPTNPTFRLRSLALVAVGLGLLTACGEITTDDVNLAFDESLSFTATAGTTSTAITNAAVVAGDSLTVAVVVGNTGTVAAGSFVVRLTDANTASSATTTTTYSATVSSLSAKSTIAVPFPFPLSSATWAALAAGSHAITVKLDSTGAVEETSEDDNSKTITIALPKVNATVTQPANESTTGTGQVVAFNVSLVSDAVATVTGRVVRWEVRRTSTGAVVDFGTATLNSGGTIAVESTVPRQGLSGTVSYDLVIDPDGSLPERLIDGGDGDNAKSFTITWNTASA